MARQSRGVMIRATQSAQRGRGGKAGGKAGKRTLGPAAHDALVKAKADGDFAELDTLSAIAETRGLPASAAAISAAAAMAALEAGDADKAMQLAVDGVGRAEGVADGKRVARHFAPLLAKLDSEPAAALSKEIRARFGLKMMPVVGETIKPNRAQRRGLPKCCGTCGHKLDGKTIHFSDDGTLDCPLCGSAVM